MLGFTPGIAAIENTLYFSVYVNGEADKSPGFYFAGHFIPVRILRNDG